MCRQAIHISDDEREEKGDALETECLIVDHVIAKSLHGERIGLYVSIDIKLS